MGLVKKRDLERMKIKYGVKSTFMGKEKARKMEQLLDKLDKFYGEKGTEKWLRSHGYGRWTSVKTIDNALEEIDKLMKVKKAKEEIGKRKQIEKVKRELERKKLEEEKRRAEKSKKMKITKKEVASNVKHLARVERGISKRTNELFSKELKPVEKKLEQIGKEREYLNEQINMLNEMSEKGELDQGRYIASLEKFRVKINQLNQEEETYKARITDLNKRMKQLEEARKQVEELMEKPQLTRGEQLKLEKYEKLLEPVESSKLKEYRKRMKKLEEGKREAAFKAGFERIAGGRITEMEKIKTRLYTVGLLQDQMKELEKYLREAEVKESKNEAMKYRRQISNLEKQIINERKRLNREVDVKKALRELSNKKKTEEEKELYNMLRKMA